MIFLHTAANLNAAIRLVHMNASAFTTLIRLHCSLRIARYAQSTELSIICYFDLCSSLHDRLKVKAARVKTNRGQREQQSRYKQIVRKFNFCTRSIPFFREIYFV